VGVEAGTGIGARQGTRVSKAVGEILARVIGCDLPDAITGEKGRTVLF
jgi:hypothetical protein